MGLKQIYFAPTKCRLASILGGGNCTVKTV